MAFSDPSCSPSPAIPSSQKRGDGRHNQEGEHGTDDEENHGTTQSGESISVAYLLKHPQGQETMWPKECERKLPFTLRTAHPRSLLAHLKIFNKIWLMVASPQAQTQCCTDREASDPSVREHAGANAGASVSSKRSQRPTAPVFPNKILSSDMRPTPWRPIDTMDQPCLGTPFITPTTIFNS